MAGMLRSCPHHDRICQHGMDCPYSCATGEYRGEKVLVRRTADDSPPADGAFGRRDGLAYQDPLNPCFPSPPSQPGGEAETKVREPNAALAHLRDHLRARADEASCDIGAFVQEGGGTVPAIMRDEAARVADQLAAFEALLAQRDALERERDEWRRVTQLQTPMGSEFATPKYCEAFLRARRDDHHETVKRFVRSAKEATARAEASEQKLEERAAAARRDALLRRVVEAVEPVDEAVRNASISGRPVVEHLGAQACERLANLLPEIAALLPSGSGEAEGGGR